MVNVKMAESLVPVYIDIFIKSGIQQFGVQCIKLYSKPRIWFIKILKKYIKDRLLNKIACPFWHLKAFKSHFVKIDAIKNDKKQLKNI